MIIEQDNNKDINENKLNIDHTYSDGRKKHKIKELSKNFIIINMTNFIHVIYDILRKGSVANRLIFHLFI